MRSFYGKFVASYLTLVIALSACASLQRHSAVVSLVVSQATMRYVEQASPTERVTRAMRIASVASDIEAVASGKPITIAELAQLAVSAIPSNLVPSDRALAVAIVNIAAQELQNKVGENVLTPEQTVTVKEVVQAVKLAASVYAPAVTP